MHIRIILEFFEKYKCPGIDIFLKSSRCVSNEQPCLKTTVLYDDLLLKKKKKENPVDSRYTILWHLGY